MSVNIMGMVKDAVSQQVMNKIGGMIGLDQSKTSSAFETAAGSILGGLLKKSSSPAGTQQVFGAVEAQDTSILDKLGDLLGGGEATDQFQKQGGGVLDMVFGGSRGAAEKAVGGSLGLGEGMIGKLMAMAAPILMSVIGNYVKSKALNAVGLGSLLGEQKSHLAGVLPSSLTSNLGFGNMLSDAGNTASNVANSATGAVSGAANSAANTAGDAAEAGSGLLKAIIPLALLVALGLGLWFFFVGPMLQHGEHVSGGGKIDRSNDGPATAGELTGNATVGIGDLSDDPTEGVGDLAGGAADGIGNLANDATQGMGGIVPDLDIEGMNLDVLGENKEKLMAPIKGITDGFAGLATGGKEAATGLADKISGFGTTLDGMEIDQMGAAQKTAVGGVLGQFSGVLEGLIAKVPAPLQGIVKPAVDGLIEKISSFGL